MDSEPTDAKSRFVCRNLAMCLARFTANHLLILVLRPSWSCLKRVFGLEAATLARMPGGLDVSLTTMRKCKNRHLCKYSVLLPPHRVLCSATGKEPVRSGHYTTVFRSRQGVLSHDADPDLRRVSGLSESIQVGAFDMVNFSAPTPGQWQPTVVTLSYLLLTGSTISAETFKFWKAWFDLVYDVQSEVPGLFNQCSGSGTISILNVRGEAVTTRQLDGVWPSSISLSDLDRNSTEPVEFTITLQVARQS